MEMSNSTQTATATMGSGLALASGLLLSGESLRGVSAVLRGSEPDAVQRRALHHLGEYLSKLADAAQHIAEGTYSPQVPLHRTALDVTPPYPEDGSTAHADGKWLYEQKARWLRETAEACWELARGGSRPVQELEDLRGELESLRQAFSRACIDAALRATL
jgi:HAMP domain-containing protein